MKNRIIKRLLKQKAVYWGSPINDGYGAYTYASPIEVNVRWENKQEKYIDHNAEEHLSQSIVFVDQDMEIGGRLSLMNLIDLSSSEQPEDNEALEIKAFSKIPDYCGIHFVRKVWL